MNGTTAAGRSHTEPNPTPFSSSNACCISRRGRWNTLMHGGGGRGGAALNEQSYGNERQPGRVTPWRSSKHTKIT